MHPFIGAGAFFASEDDLTFQRKSDMLIKAQQNVELLFEFHNI